MNSEQLRRAGRTLMTVGAGRIEAGDWMRDRGEMKEVVAVDPVTDRVVLVSGVPRAARGVGPSAYLVRFTASPSAEVPQESHLYIPADVSVSVWRARVGGLA